MILSRIYMVNIQLQGYKLSVTNLFFPCFWLITTTVIIVSLRNGRRMQENEICQILTTIE